MKIKINSYRANSKVFDIGAVEDTYIEFDMSDVDYITSDGFSAIIKLMQQGRQIKLVNINEHIRITIEMIKLEQIM